ncbi:hypothetical protein [Cellulosimicrobium funkei]|uniref:hypothetical protein n=1 Tax=Cellulosimicrobium funkei TaxID=264251 RepID=UPI00367671A0
MLTWIESHPGLLGALGLLVAVVGIPTTVWVTRRYAGGRRTKVIASWTSVRMVRRANLEGLEVRLRGAVLQDPHLITVTLRNLGPSDVATANFHGGNPLEIKLRGARAVDLVGSTNATVPCTLDSDGERLLLGPAHIPTKGGRSVVLLAEGQPRTLSFGDLVDVDLECEAGTAVSLRGRRVGFWSLGRTAVTATAMLAAFLAVATMLSTLSGPPR